MYYTLLGVGGDCIICLLVFQIWASFMWILGGWCWARVLGQGWRDLWLSLWVAEFF